MNCLTCVISIVFKIYFMGIYYTVNESNGFYRQSGLVREPPQAEPTTFRAYLNVLCFETLCNKLNVVAR